MGHYSYIYTYIYPRTSFQCHRSPWSSNMLPITSLVIRLQISDIFTSVPAAVAERTNLVPAIVNSCSRGNNCKTKQETNGFRFRALTTAFLEMYSMVVHVCGIVMTMQNSITSAVCVYYLFQLLVCANSLNCTEPLLQYHYLRESAMQLSGRPTTTSTSLCLTGATFGSCMDTLVFQHWLRDHCSSPS